VVSAETNLPFRYDEQANTWVGIKSVGEAVRIDALDKDSFVIINKNG